MRRKKLALLSLAALLCLLLSGCFVKTVDELYTLPRTPTNMTICKRPSTR